MLGGVAILLARLLGVSVTVTLPVAGAVFLEMLSLHTAVALSAFLFRLWLFKMVSFQTLIYAAFRTLFDVINRTATFPFRNAISPTWDKFHPRRAVNTVGFPSLPESRRFRSVPVNVGGHTFAVAVNFRKFVARSLTSAFWSGPAHVVSNFALVAKCRVAIRDFFIFTLSANGTASSVDALAILDSVVFVARLGALGGKVWIRRASFHIIQNGAENGTIFWSV